MVRREQYERLEQYLRADARPRIEMTFAEVTGAIAEELPRSAYEHPAWWGSDPKHTQAVWLDAGYVASPNLKAEKVIFTRKPKNEPSTTQEQLSRTGRSRGYQPEGLLAATTGQRRLPGGIFISYRREETSWAAGWLFDRLSERFGAGQVFMDVDSIDLGGDFVEGITSAVISCDVLLPLIGERWATITDEFGQRRLNNPKDFVRLEIETALARNIRVIPILVDNARMPTSDQLPSSMAMLVRRQALELSPGRRFASDVARLIKELEKALAEVRKPTQPGSDAAGYGTLPRTKRPPGQNVRLSKRVQEKEPTIRESIGEVLGDPKKSPPY